MAENYSEISTLSIFDVKKSMADLIKAMVYYLYKTELS